MRSYGLIAFGMLLGFLLAVGHTCKAQTWVVGSGFAQHLDRESHCNNHVTPGIGIELGNYAIGAYDNSNCKLSLYAAKFWTPIHLGTVRLGTLAGLVSGYEKPVLPVGALVAAWEGEKYGLNLIFIPPVAGSGNVAWLQWKVRW